ncbi:hypothetical protein CDAR_390231 [Caerostris darwini]|uniref:Uncharacterized protein n=1 Tax=Caerostris darwini TaxID=1538125 RepID=A0AAV4NXG6_9ARAC|nr:hypothetical protein CDAR_390231 [Caerostris darwini]
MTVLEVVLQASLNPHESSELLEIPNSVGSRRRVLPFQPALCNHVEKLHLAQMPRNALAQAAEFSGCCIFCVGERNQVRYGPSDAADKRRVTSGLRPTCIEGGDPALREAAARNGTITFSGAIERFPLSKS